MELIDTHAHLYLDEFKHDLVALLDRAKQHHVQQVLLPNISTESVKDLKQLLHQHPDFFKGMMGLHPCYITGEYEKKLSIIKDELFKSPDLYCAVGEIGIDLYWDKTNLSEQIKVFKTQIEWAAQLQKPIVIHARDSFDEIFKVLDEVDISMLSGVFHCFTGNQSHLEKIISYPNFYIGIGGVLTFKNSDLKNIVPLIPKDRLLLETDAPYLSPVPKRGKQNESSYLIYILNCLAELLQCSPEALAQLTTQNSKYLFKLS